MLNLYRIMLGQVLKVTHITSEGSGQLFGLYALTVQYITLATIDMLVVTDINK